MGCNVKNKIIQKKTKMKVGSFTAKKKTACEIFCENQCKILCRKYTFLSFAQIKQRALEMWKKSQKNKKETKLQQRAEVNNKTKRTVSQKSKTITPKLTSPKKHRRALVPLNINLTPVLTPGILKRSTPREPFGKYVSFNSSPEIRYCTASESSHSTLLSKKLSPEKQNNSSFFDDELCINKYNLKTYSRKPSEGQNSQSDFDNLINNNCTWSYRSWSTIVEDEISKEAEISNSNVKMQHPLKVKNSWTMINVTHEDKNCKKEFNIFDVRSAGKVSHGHYNGFEIDKIEKKTSCSSVSKEKRRTRQTTADENTLTYFDAKNKKYETQESPEIDITMSLENKENVSPNTTLQKNSSNKNDLFDMEKNESSKPRQKSKKRRKKKPKNRKRSSKNYLPLSGSSDSSEDEIVYQTRISVQNAKAPITWQEESLSEGISDTRESENEDSANEKENEGKKSFLKAPDCSPGKTSLSCGNNQNFKIASDSCGNVLKGKTDNQIPTKIESLQIGKKFPIKKSVNVDKIANLKESFESSKASKASISLIAESNVLEIPETQQFCEDLEDKSNYNDNSLEEVLETQVNHSEICVNDSHEKKNTNFCCDSELQTREKNVVDDFFQGNLFSENDRNNIDWNEAIGNQMQLPERINDPKSFSKEKTLKIKQKRSQRVSNLNEKAAESEALSAIKVKWTKQKDFKSSSSDVSNAELNQTLNSTLTDFSNTFYDPLPKPLQNLKDGCSSNVKSTENIKKNQCISPQSLTCKNEPGRSKKKEVVKYKSWEELETQLLSNCSVDLNVDNSFEDMFSKNVQRNFNYPNFNMPEMTKNSFTFKVKNSDGFSSSNTDDKINCEIPHKNSEVMPLKITKSQSVLEKALEAMKLCTSVDIQDISGAPNSDGDTISINTSYNENHFSQHQSVFSFYSKDKEYLKTATMDSVLQTKSLQNGSGIQIKEIKCKKKIEVMKKRGTEHLEANDSKIIKKKKQHESIKNSIQNNFLNKTENFALNEQETNFSYRVASVIVSKEPKFKKGKPFMEDNDVNFNVNDERATNFIEDQTASEIESLHARNNENTEEEKSESKGKKGTNKRNKSALSKRKNPALRNYNASIDNKKAESFSNNLSLITNNSCEIKRTNKTKKKQEIIPVEKVKNNEKSLQAKCKIQSNNLYLKSSESGMKVNSLQDKSKLVSSGDNHSSDDDEIEEINHIPSSKRKNSIISFKHFFEDDSPISDSSCDSGNITIKRRLQSRKCKSSQKNLISVQKCNKKLSSKKKQEWESDSSVIIDDDRSDICMDKEELTSNIKNDASSIMEKQRSKNKASRETRITKTKTRDGAKNSNSETLNLRKTNNKIIAKENERVEQNGKISALEESFGKKSVDSIQICSDKKDFELGNSKVISTNSKGLSPKNGKTRGIFSYDKESYRTISPQNNNNNGSFKKKKTYNIINREDGNPEFSLNAHESSFSDENTQSIQIQNKIPEKFNYTGKAKSNPKPREEYLKFIKSHILTEDSETCIKNLSMLRKDETKSKLNDTILSGKITRGKDQGSKLILKDDELLSISSDSSSNSSPKLNASQGSGLLCDFFDP